MDKYTNGDAADIIDNEGIGYAVRHYTKGSSFKDAKTSMLWESAERSLNALVEYLQRETGREIGG